MLENLTNLLKAKHISAAHTTTQEFKIFSLPVLTKIVFYEICGKI